MPYPRYPLAQSLLRSERAQNPCADAPAELLAATEYVGIEIVYEFNKLPKTHEVMAPESVMALAHSLGLITAVREILYAFYLNSRNKYLAHFMVSAGNIAESLGTPPTVFGPAVAVDAKGVILMHNHPSGVPKPSKQDIALTGRLIGTGRKINIVLLDHLIVGKNKTFGFEFLSLRNEYADLFRS
jgi:DNA repair protein RadC